MSKVLDLVLAGPTSQFDADASLATTEFVQRSLGNMRAATGISGNATLTATHVGQVIQLSNAGPYTVTLPLLAGLPDGASIQVACSASGTITIQRQGSDTIHPNMGSAITSFTIKAGDSATLTKTNGVWGLLGGSAALRSSTGDFGSDMQRPGYQKLPSGLIIQWGTTPASSSSAGVSTTFPIAFPNVCWIVDVQVSASSNGFMASLESISTTGFTSSMYSNNTTRASGVTSYYIAIGY